MLDSWWFPENVLAYRVFLATVTYLFRLLHSISRYLDIADCGDTLVVLALLSVASCPRRDQHVALFQCYHADCCHVLGACSLHSWYDFFASMFAITVAVCSPLFVLLAQLLQRSHGRSHCRCRRSWRLLMLSLISLVVVLIDDGCQGR